MTASLEKRRTCTSRRDDLVVIGEILDAARNAVEFARGRTQADVEQDTMLFFALVRALEIVGEASKNVSPAFRSAHSELPWSDMARTRDRLIHGYANVSPAIVWQIVCDDLPRVIAALARLLSD